MFFVGVYLFLPGLYFLCGIGKKQFTRNLSCGIFIVALNQSLLPIWQSAGSCEAPASKVATRFQPQCHAGPTDQPILQFVTIFFVSAPVSFHTQACVRCLRTECGPRWSDSIFATRDNNFWRFSPSSLDFPCISDCTHQSCCSCWQRCTGGFE